MENTRTIQTEKTIEKHEKLHAITHVLHGAKDLDEILLFLKDEVVSLFDADRSTIYFVDADRSELFSKVKEGEEIKEIRIPLDTSSIAGYVGTMQRPCNISDVRNADELRALGPDVSFDETWDMITGYKTRQVLAGPILHNNILKGVIQIVNKQSADRFTVEDEKYLAEICKVLGLVIYNQNRMEKRRTKFDYLLSTHIISEEELNRAITLSRQAQTDIAGILVNEFNVPKKEIGRSLEAYYNKQFIEYDEKIVIDKKLIKDLKIPYLKKHFWTPFYKDNDVMVILIDDPENEEKIKEIKLLMSAEKHEFFVALRDDILKFLDHSISDKKDAVSLVEPESPYEKAEEIHETDEHDEELEESRDIGIIQTVNRILREAYQRGASDIHIEPMPGNRPTRIRFRLDGVCFHYQEIPFQMARPLISRIKIMARLDIAEKRLPQSGKIKLMIGNKEVELRVETTPTVGDTENVVLRILSSGKPLPLARMNFSRDNLKSIMDIIEKPYGMFLVVGPTGSGKTTTLHSVLAHLNKPEVKIWTAEDPVEITQEGLCQVQTHAKIGYTFAAAMRSFLRADPDIIMIGEMRDAESAQIVIEASLTGHLVLSTLHTNSAPETVTRLIDMGMNPFNFADALLGILAQRLVRTLCDECKESYRPDYTEFNQLVQEYGEMMFERLGIEFNDDLTLWRARKNGCEKCNHTGYHGRAAIHELLAADRKIKELVQSSAHMDVIREAALGKGMCTLKQDGIQKIFKGQTDLMQVRRVCIE